MNRLLLVEYIRAEITALRPILGELIPAFWQTYDYRASVSLISSIEVIVSPFTTMVVGGLAAAWRIERYGLTIRLQGGYFGRCYGKSVEDQLLGACSSMISSAWGNSTGR